MILKENEWQTINTILLDLYEIQDIETLVDKILKSFRMIIPYTQGYYLILDTSGEIDTKRSSFLFTNESSVQQYLKHYYHIDYLKYISDCTKKTTTYRDTDILTGEIRKKTRFYIEFLEPGDMPYGCGIIMFKDSQIIGVLNLFRSRELGDFTDKEIYILDILKLHIRNIQHKLIKVSVNEDCDKNRDVYEKYSLTDREIDVINLVCAGATNMEIAEKLVISISTVKKHFNNIYHKMGINGRTKLVLMVGNNSKETNRT